MKNINEILQFQNDTFGKISTDPETAFTFFKKLWLSLTIDEKKIFAPQVLRHCMNIINNDQDFTVPEMD